MMNTTHKNRKHVKKSGHKLSSSSNRQKQIVLTLVAITWIAIFFTLPIYRHWLMRRIIPYYRTLPVQLQCMETEQRLIDRHGYDYLIPRFIHDQLPSGAVLLLPPKRYVKQHFLPRQFRWHHIVWNYYFFGKQPLVQFRKAKSADLALVTHAVICSGDKIQLQRVETPGDIRRVLSDYTQQKNNRKLASTD